MRYKLGNFTRFLYELLSQFFSGLIIIIQAIGNGLKQSFNFKTYQEIIDSYKGSLSGGEWALVVGSIIVLVIFVILIVVLFVLSVKMRFKLIKKIFWMKWLL